MSNFDILVKIGADTSNLGKTLASATNSVSKYGKGFGQLSDTATKNLDNIDDGMQANTLSADQLAKGIAKIAGAFVGIAALKNIVGKAIGRVDTIDTATKSLTVLTGDAKMATRIMAGLAKGIEGTPIALDQVALGAKKMVAAGMDGRKVEGTFKAISDAAYGVGNGTQSIDQMTDAIASMQSAGMVYADDINRLVDAGVPAWKILANATGQSVTKMKKEVSTGALESNKAIAMLTKGIEEGTDGLAGHTAKMAGLAKTAGDTISGSYANMKTAAVKSIANIITALKGPIIGSLQGLTNFFKLAAKGTELFAKGIEFGVKAVKFLSPILAPLAVGLSAVAASLLATTIATKAASGFKILSKYMKIAFNTMAANPVALVIGAIAALAFGVYQAYKRFEPFRNAVNKVSATLKNAFEPAINSVKLLLNTVGKIFGDFGKSVSSSAKNSGVAAAAMRLLGEVGAFLSNVLDNVGKYINIAAEGIAAFFNTVDSKLSTVDAASIGFNDLMSGIKMLAPVAMALLSPLGAVFGAIKLGAKLLSSNDLQKGIDTFTSSFKTFGSSISKNANKIGGSIGNIVLGAGKAISVALPKIIEAGLLIINGLVQGLSKGVPNVIGSIIKLVSVIGTEIGKGLPKLAKAGADIIAGLLNGLTQNIGRVVLAGVELVVSLINAIASNIGKLIVAGGNLIVSFLQGVTTQIPSIIIAATQLITTFLNSLTSNLPSILNAGINFVLTYIKGITSRLSDIIPTVITFVATFLNQLSAEMPKLIESGAKLIVSIIQGITNSLPSWITAIVNLIVTFVTELSSHAGEIISAGTNLIVALLQGLTSAIPQIIKAITNLAVSIITELGKSAKSFIQAGAKVISKILQGISDSVGTVIKAIADLVVNVLNTISKNQEKIRKAAVNLIISFIKGIGQSVSSVVRAVWDLVDTIVKKILDSQQRFYNAAETLLNGLARGIRQNHGGVKKAAENLMDAIVKSFPGGKLLKNGVALIGGLLDGMKRKYQEVKSFVGGIASWIQDHKGPISYDKKLLIPAGKAIMLGLNQGLNSGFKGISKSVSGMGTAIKDSLNAKQMQKAATSLGTSIQNYIDKGFYSKKSNVGKVNNLAKTIKTQQAQLKAVVTRRKNTTKKLTQLNKQLVATPKTKKTASKRSSLASQITTAKNQLAGYNAQVKAINNRIKTSQSKLKTLAIDKKQASQALGLASIQSFIKKQTNKLVSIAKQRDTIVAKLKDANKKLSDLTKESKKYAEDAAKTITDYASVTNLQGTTNLKASDIDTYLQQRVKAIKTFQTNIAKLRKKGVNKNIIEDILNVGVDGGSAYAKALAGADSKTITSINKTQKSIETASKSMGTAAANAMYGAGINAAKGLIKGLQSQQKALNKQADKIGASIVKAIKKKLKIHSPSRTLRDEVGQYIPLGIVEGINSKISDIQQASDRMVAAAVPDTSRLSQSISADMNGAISQSVTADVDGQGNMFDKLASRIDSLGDRLEGMAVQIDGKAAGKILRPHISEEEAKEQRRQFKAKGLSFNN